MRQTLGLFTLVGLSALAAPRLAPFTLADFAKALQDAKSLHADSTLQTIGGTAERYSVDLRKPNLLRVETPGKVVVSDGKNVTTYLKDEKLYYKQPVTDGTLMESLSGEALSVWAGFFNGKALTPVASRSLGTRVRNGLTLEAVEASFDAKGTRTVTYFIDPKDRIARQAQIDVKTPDGKVTKILNAKDVQIDLASGADAFTFKAPGGSRETTLKEANAPKWLNDLDEAKSTAARTGRIILVDFSVENNAQLKGIQDLLFETERFQKYAKERLVLVRIDVQDDTATAKTYGVTKIPTQLLLDRNGALIASLVGYGGVGTFYDFLSAYVG